MDDTRSFLIDGQWVGGGARARLAVGDPSTARELASVWLATPADVDAAVAAARRSFEASVWRGLSGDERARILWRVADLIDAHRHELADLEMRNTGKPLASCVDGEVPFAAQCFRYFAGHCAKIEGRTLQLSGLPAAAFQAATYLEPVGVVAAIVPWNGPLVQACWKLGPALAAGCSLLIKPSEMTPLTTLRLGELMVEAGVPAGVVNILPGAADVGRAFAAHPGIDKISFTGSNAVGKQLLAGAAGNLKRLTLELGGKSPVLVLADADLDAAAEGIAGGIFSNAGQVCVAGSRAYVARGLYPALLQRVVDRARALRVGPGSDPQSEMGPLMSAAHLQRVHRMVEQAKADGARVETGGHAIDLGGGHYYAPTVLTGLRPEMQILCEEVFGPVLCMQPFDDPAELEALANDSVFGLAASIWTRDLGAAHRLAARVRAGLVWINCHGIPDMAMPFGGFKQSGWGRENGADAVLEYLETRSVMIKL